MSAIPPQSTAAGTTPTSVPLVTSTPNPAVDITYQVEQVVFGTSHRVERIHRRAGGKGLNTASVLALMGYPVVATGFSTSPDYVADLQWHEAESPGRSQWRALEIPRPNRLSVTAVAGGDATLFNETAPNYGELAATEIAATWENVWERVLDYDWAPPGVLASINGSFLLSTPLGVVSRLVAGLHSRGCWVLVDISGKYLVEAVRAGTDYLKLNVAGLRTATGVHEVPAAARALLELGAGFLLVSTGRDGLAYVCRDGGPEIGEARESDRDEDFGQPLMNGTEKPASKAEPQVKAFWVRPGRELSDNPTGAGDAAVVGFLAVRAQSLGQQAALARAVAWSAAAIPVAYAGVIKTELVGELRHEITYKTEDWS